MPTVFRDRGFRLFFFSNESGKPAHIHVEHGEHLVKIWLERVEVAQNYGMDAKNLRIALQIVKENQSELLGKWHEHFGA